MAFSFSFSGDDIDAQGEPAPSPSAAPAPAAAGAFPVPGKPQLPPTRHALPDMLAQLPSKIAYGVLDVALDDGSRIRIPRRELWDVRVQLMAEDEGDGGQDAASEGLGAHDVKTGVYEGGFKSWESSVDLVKVLAASDPLGFARTSSPSRVIELGCGTALPSMALFQWAMSEDASRRRPRSFVVADYNPTVLQLVTLPNFILSWSLNRPQDPALADAFAIEGELELSDEVREAFSAFLRDSCITLSFVSGAWSPEFVQLVDDLHEAPSPDDTAPSPPPLTLLLGAETIYSPFALQAFTQTVFEILRRERQRHGDDAAAALVGAKRLYFGVGGSLDDFVERARNEGGSITHMREEEEGVRRGVVKCVLSGGGQDSHNPISPDAS